MSVVLPPYLCPSPLNTIWRKNLILSFTWDWKKNSSGMWASQGQIGFFFFFFGLFCSLVHSKHLDRNWNTILSKYLLLNDKSQCFSWPRGNCSFHFIFSCVCVRKRERPTLLPGAELKAWDILSLILLQINIMCTRQNCANSLLHGLFSCSSWEAGDGCLKGTPGRRWGHVGRSHMAIMLWACSQSRKKMESEVVAKAEPHP